MHSASHERVTRWQCQTLAYMYHDMYHGAISASVSTSDQSEIVVLVAHSGLVRRPQSAVVWQLYPTRVRRATCDEPIHAVTRRSHPRYPPLASTSIVVVDHDYVRTMRIISRRN